MDYKDTAGWQLAEHYSHLQQFIRRADSRPSGGGSREGAAPPPRTQSPGGAVFCRRQSIECNTSDDMGQPGGSRDMKRV